MTDRELIETIEDANSDCISRQGLKESLLSEDYEAHDYCFPCKEIMKRIDEQPSEQPDHIADGDKKDDHFREVTKKVDVIYRQAAIDEIRKCRFVVDAIEKIRRLPSAQPEVLACGSGELYAQTEHKIIRCRECRNYDGETCDILNNLKFSEDDFCSYAERKEG